MATPTPYLTAPLRDLEAWTRYFREAPIPVLAKTSEALEALRQPMEVYGRDVLIGASIGVAMHPPMEGDIDVLMNHADQAMYCAKRAGKGRLHHAQAA